MWFKKYHSSPLHRDLDFGIITSVHLERNRSREWASAMAGVRSSVASVLMGLRPTDILLSFAVYLSCDHRQGEYSDGGVCFLRA